MIPCMWKRLWEDPVHSGTAHVARGQVGEQGQGRASPLPVAFLNGRSTSTTHAPKYEVGASGILPLGFLQDLQSNREMGIKATGQML